MVSAAIIALVLVAWYGVKTYQVNTRAKLLQAQERRFELTHWKKEEEHESIFVERILSFPEMKLTTNVSDSSDHGYLADMYIRQKESWDQEHQELESDGWTEEEWLNHEVKVYEVRRLSDGTWQGRLEWKRWKAAVHKALASLFASSETDFKELTGITKGEWKARGDYHNDELRPWTTITTDGPSIEAGYQRFIHNPEA